MSDFEPYAVVIADSISADTATRLTTIQLAVHRWILPQLLGHHELVITERDTRNQPIAASFNHAETAAVYPTYWSKERLGAQTTRPVSGPYAALIRERWDAARLDAVDHAARLAELGVHRSICRRLLEPFTPAVLVCTSTNYECFLRQHLHPQDPTAPLADNEINAAAFAISAALDASTPEKIANGQWHLPYLSPWELENLSLRHAYRTSMVRLTAADRKAQPNNDRDILATAKPRHYDATQHIWTPALPGETVLGPIHNWLPLRTQDIERSA